MDNIYKKLFQIQLERNTFKKTANNPFYHSKYLPFEELSNQLNPTLEKYKLLILHRTVDSEVVTRVVDIESMEFIESNFPIQAGIDPQKVGSAITYGKRYNVGQIFNIITDVDDDGNSSTTPPTSHENAPQTSFTPPRHQTYTKADLGHLDCSICSTKSNAKTIVWSTTKNKPYCENWKKHKANKEFSNILGGDALRGYDDGEPPMEVQRENDSVLYEPIR